MTGQLRGSTVASARSTAAGMDEPPTPGQLRPALPTPSRSGRPSPRPGLLLVLLLMFGGPVFAQTNVVVDFEKAEITGRWIESWEEQGVMFTPAHAPTKSKARARLMFFPHVPSERKGILSAMADDPIPVRARFPTNVSSVTLVLWGSTGCAARLEAYDRDGQLVDKASRDVIPGRKSPGDSIPTFELTVKGSNIAYVQFSGPRTGEFLAADELRFTLDAVVSRQR